MHLGTLSPAVREPELVTFDWYGVTIRSAPVLSDLVLVDLMSQFGNVDFDDPASLGPATSAAKGLARDIIHPDDFTEFWRTAKTNGAGVVDVMAIAKALIEAFAARPTMQPAVSSDGLSTTLTNSVATPEWIAESVLPGRPDLQQAVLSAVPQSA